MTDALFKLEPFDVIILCYSYHLMRMYNELHFLWEYHGW